MTLFSFANDDYYPKIYMGIGGGILNNNIYRSNISSNETYKSNPSFGSIKFGYGDIKAYSVELNLYYINNKTNVFSNNDKAGYAVDVSFLKAWDFGIYLLPYVSVGLGGGFMGIDRELDKTLGFGSYNVGAGAKLPLYKHLELEFKYEYKFVSYEGIDLISETAKYKSHTNMFYFGINTRF